VVLEKVSWTDRVNNEAVLHRVKEERNILHTVRRRKANCIGHILRRNSLLKHIIEGKIRGTRRRGRRRKQLLDDLKETRRFWKLKRKLRITLFGELRSVWKRLWTCRKTDHYLNNSLFPLFENCNGFSCRDEVRMSLLTGACIKGSLGVGIWFQGDISRSKHEEGEEQNKNPHFSEQTFGACEQDTENVWHNAGSKSRLEKIRQ
jgi:hypothetical protein